MPRAFSPDSINAALALAGARALAMRRQRTELQTQVDEWRDERDSLASFTPAVFKTDTGRPAIPPAHLERIIEVLEDDGLGDTVIIAPPASAKTNTLISACSWWLGRDRNQHIGYFSNTDRQAYRRSVAVRDTVARNGVFGSIFPDLMPDYRKGWAEFEWYLQRDDVGDKDASFMAAGVGSAIQGSRLNRVLLDDIADKKNMATELQREKVIEWLVQQVMSRRSPGCRSVMICTRWHPDDPAAWAMAQGWRVIHIPAITADESFWRELWPLNKLACPNDLHGLADDDWEPTPEMMRPPCWVDRDPMTGRVLAQGNCAKLVFGSRAFNLTYQGETTPEEGELFKRNWWKRYRVLPAGATRGGIFIDTATDDKSTGDPFAMATWRTSGLDFYVERVLNKQLAFPDQVRAVLDFHAASRQRDDDPGLPVYIEEVPWALPLIRTLQGMLPAVIGVKPGGHSKVARAMAASPFVEAGNVYLPEDAIWVSDFIDQHAAFPDVSHDDMVDTTSLALHQLGAMALPAKAPRPTAVKYGPAAPVSRETQSELEKVRARQAERRNTKAKGPMAPRRGGI